MRGCFRLRQCGRIKRLTNDSLIVTRGLLKCLGISKLGTWTRSGGGHKWFIKCYPQCEQIFSIHPNSIQSHSRKLSYLAASHAIPSLFYHPKSQRILLNRISWSCCIKSQRTSSHATPAYLILSPGLILAVQEMIAVKEEKRSAWIKWRYSKFLIPCRHDFCKHSVALKMLIPSKYIALGSRHEREAAL